MRTKERRKDTVNQSQIPQTVVWFLGVVALVLSMGIIFLLWQGKTPDAALYSMGTAAIASLGTLLSSTSPRPTQPSTAPQEVISTPGQPLQMEDATPPDDEPTDDLPQDDAQTVAPVKPAAKRKTNAK